MFDVEFLGLKLSLAALAIVIGFWLYGRYIQGKTLPTTDDLFSAVKTQVEKLEVLITKKALEAETKAIEIVKAQTTKEAIDADVAKLKTFVEKVKAIF